jgi:DinB family protein
MSTTTRLEATALLGRTLAEGYGPGAWHGADFKAAIADVSDRDAFRRPAAERHNIAEIALHHAYCVRNVRGRLSGAPLEPFILEGDDWFPVSGDDPVTWPQIRQTVETEQKKLAEVVEGVARGRTSPLSETEQFEIVLGITCHAVYHAGQVQLVKKFL